MAWHMGSEADGSDSVAKQVRVAQLHCWTVRAVSWQTHKNRGTQRQDDNKARRERKREREKEAPNNSLILSHRLSDIVTQNHTRHAITQTEGVEEKEKKGSDTRIKIY